MKSFVSYANAVILCCGFSASTIAQTQVHQDINSPKIYMAGIQLDSEESPLDFGVVPDESQPDPQSLATEMKSQATNPVDSIIENTEQKATAGKKLTETNANVGGNPVDGSNFAPLFWSQGSYSHNAMADYMRLQWCTDGLWDSFAAEQAARCALQYERISGSRRHRCGSCGHFGVHAYSGHCCGLGNHCGISGACGVAGQSCGESVDCPPVNRYRLHRRRGCDACTHSNTTGCHTTGCESSGGESCDHCPSCDSTSHSILHSPTTSSDSANSHPASGTSVVHDSAGRVAFLPLTSHR